MTAVMNEENPHNRRLSTPSKPVPTIIAPDDRRTDIILIGWWAHLPRAWHPYLYLARFDRPIGWWLLLLPGWWVIPLAADSINQMAWLMTLFLIGAVTMRAAGCVVNDIWDRRIDLRVERTSIRPIAAGTVTLFQAFLFLASLSLIGLIVLMQMPLISIWVGLASLPLIIIYPLAKRVTWWPQFVLGLTFSWGVPLGWAATSGTLPAAPVWLIYAGTVCWVFGYDTIYAVQDMADDPVAGVKSSALGLGKHLITGVGVAYGLAMAMIAGGIWWYSGAGIWIIGMTAMALHLAWQIRHLDSSDAKGALRLFQSNRDAGLILTAALVADLVMRQ